MSQTIAVALSNVRIDKLDAEILLAYVLNVARSYLHAWPEKQLTAEQEKEFFEMVQHREQGEPLPYLVGHQEFWSLDFIVTPATLIPRPETELLVELVLEKIQGEKKLIADLGTGSGAIAAAIAHEHSDWIIHAVDQSNLALDVAKRNANNLKLKNIFFHLGNWCDALPSLEFDVIVSNPPYIAENDIHLTQESIRFEPVSALVSGVDGLNAIREIISSAAIYLKPNGYLMLEHGYQQAAAVRKIFIEKNFNEVSSHRDLSGWERVTIGRMAKENFHK